MNIKKTLIGTTAAALMLGSVVTVAYAASLVTNGSFETGPNPDGFITLSSGDTSITGWKVGTGNIDYIGTYWQPQDGDRSIDLSGDQAGSISQTFPTIASHIYKVIFYMAGNPYGEPTIKTLNTNVGSGPIPFTFDVTGHDTTNMGWEQKTFNFTATATTTTLTFTSTTNTLFGPALDNVAVEDIATIATSKDQCKKGGWQNLVDAKGKHFKNQGDCVSYVATKGKNPGSIGP